MSYKVKDFYFKKAKQQNFLARSVFKLEEIQKKTKVLKIGQKILDLGCAPGSWSQYACQVIGPQGFLLGIDLKPVGLNLPNARFIQANLLEASWEDLCQDQAFDAVLSDMAPHTTGIRITDQARSLHLCELALMISQSVLKPYGNFVCKVFFSDDVSYFANTMRNIFEKVVIIRPQSTRKSSTEVFLVGMSKKPL